MYKASFFPRDWKDSDERDWAAANKLAKDMPNPRQFEFGNSVMDEYVVVVTDSEALQAAIIEDEDFGHNCCLLTEGEDGFIHFEDMDELRKRVSAAVEEYA